MRMSETKNRIAPEGWIYGAKWLLAEPITEVTVIYRNCTILYGGLFYGCHTLPHLVHDALVEAESGLLRTVKRAYKIIQLHNKMRGIRDEHSSDPELSRVTVL